MQGLLGAADGASGGSSQGGWWSDIVKKWKEGKFKTYARWLGVANVFLMVGLTSFLFGSVLPQKNKHMHTAASCSGSTIKPQCLNILPQYQQDAYCN